MVDLCGIGPQRQPCLRRQGLELEGLLTGLATRTLASGASGACWVSSRAAPPVRRFIPCMNEDEQVRQFGRAVRQATRVGRRIARYAHDAASDRVGLQATRPRQEISRRSGQRRGLDRQCRSDQCGSPSETEGAY